MALAQCFLIQLSRSLEWDFKIATHSSLTVRAAGKKCLSLGVGVVDFVGLDLLDDVDQAVADDEIAVLQDEIAAGHVGVW